MIIRFEDSSYVKLKQGINHIKLKDYFLALSGGLDSISLFSDDYAKELNAATHLVWVNDLVVDDWLSIYKLQLEKLVAQQLVQSLSFSDWQSQSDILANQLSDNLLMLDLPIGYQRDLEFGLPLVKYLKLKLVHSLSVQDRFEQLLNIHSRLCSQKVLVINHAKDYHIFVDNEMIKEMHLVVLFIEN